MQLIGQFDSPFVRRVGIALTLYGRDFAHLPYSNFREWEKFAAHNPLRRVPALVLDTGEALIDSTAILDYLDELHGRDTALLAPSGPVRRAAQRRIALACGIADKAVSFFYAGLFATALDPAFCARNESQITAGLAALEAECAGRDTAWWHGDGPGHDDIAAACVVRFLTEAYPHLVAARDYPALAAHCAAAEALPAFKAVQQAFIPPR